MRKTTNALNQLKPGRHQVATRRVVGVDVRARRRVVDLFVAEQDRWHVVASLDRHLEKEVNLRNNAMTHTNTSGEIASSSLLDGKRNDCASR